MKRLPGEPGGRQARHGERMIPKRQRDGIWLTAHQARCTATASTISPTVGPPRGAFRPAGLINELDQIQLLGDPNQSTHIADQSRPDRLRRTQVGDRGGISEPNTAWRANGRCLAVSHNDWDAIRYSPPSHLTFEYVH